MLLATTYPTLSELQNKQFDAIIQAIIRGEVAHLATTIKATGEPVAAICIITQSNDSYLVTPIGHLRNENPIDYYTKPE